MKLISYVTVDDVMYGPIIDTRQPGELEEDFHTRHASHVYRYVKTNFPEGKWTSTTTTNETL